MTSITTDTTAANHAGLRTGQSSELTVIAPLKEGGADRLRALTSGRKDIQDAFRGIRTVHDLRWVIFDNDTRVIFATTYDGDWDSYIDDFATGIPQVMDTLFGNVEGYPGIASPTIKDFIAAHQVTATAWYSAYPALRVTDIDRHQKISDAVDGLLDAVNP